MFATQAPVTEGARLLEELLAAHMVMTRGAELVAGSFGRLADGAAVDTSTLVRIVRWLVGFVCHHRRTEDELLWPVLRERRPETVRSLDLLDEEDDALAEGLDELESVIERISEERRAGGSVSWGHAMKQGTLASHRVRHGLTEQFAVVEPLFKGLLARAREEDLRAARRRPKASGAASRIWPSDSWSTPSSCPAGNGCTRAFSPRALGPESAGEQVPQDPQGSRGRLSPASAGTPAARGRGFSGRVRRARSSCGPGTRQP